MATVVHVCKTKTLLGWFLHASSRRESKACIKNFKFRQQDARTFQTTAINIISICWVNFDAFSVIFSDCMQILECKQGILLITEYSFEVAHLLFDSWM